MVYRLYRKKKNGVESIAPRNTSDDATIRYVGSRPGEEARVEYPTLSPGSDQPELPDGDSSNQDQLTGGPPVYQEQLNTGYVQYITPLWSTAHPNP